MKNDWQRQISIHPTFVDPALIQAKARLGSSFHQRILNLLPFIRGARAVKVKIRENHLAVSRSRRLPLLKIRPIT